MDAGEVPGVVGCDSPHHKHAAALPRAVAAAADVHPGVFLLVPPQQPAYGRCSPVTQHTRIKGGVMTSDRT